jgi:predicted NAD/FAD-binding protein
MRIAVVGSGISGLATAYLLTREGKDVTVLEAESRLGGHTHTVRATVPSGTYSVDTGFIVFNDWTYPNFIALMNELGVKWKDSSMSFSVKVERNGLEYNGTSLNTLFAQRLNLFRPSFHRMIKDILRFNRESPAVLNENHPDRLMTLSEYLKKHAFGTEFAEHYLIPMGAAIWSASKEQMGEFPIEFFVRFFKNHGMLSVDDRPVWKVIEGGSSSYIAPLIKSFREKIKYSARVQSVQRTEVGVRIDFEAEGRMQSENFDQVVLAGHSDQTLGILKDASPLELELLGCFSYQPNQTVLHTDTSVLPKRKLAWAAWNYSVPKAASKSVSVSYNMNILQGIKSPETFCVSLNMDSSIDPAKILRRFEYHHPVYSTRSFQAQKRWAEISGVNRVHFAGAYWGYGFHEDGVKSALAVCKSFGVTL